jgi:hypothetical protein
MHPQATPFDLQVTWGAGVQKRTVLTQGAAAGQPAGTASGSEPGPPAGPAGGAAASGDLGSESGSDCHPGQASLRPGLGPGADESGLNIAPGP